MRFSLYLVAAFAAFIGLASPCNAQLARTYVSGVGSDSNPCSRTAPCGSLNAAIGATIEGGEVACLDAGTFDTPSVLSITKSISILCDGVNGGVAASFNDNTITVNLPSATDKVIISGLSIDGYGLTTGNSIQPGATGVLINGLGTVTIRNSLIKNFTTSGVSLTGSANARVFIINSQLTNDGTGIIVQGMSGVANYATLIDTIVDGNANYGAQIAAGNKLTIERCTITGTSVSVSNTGGTFISVGPSSYFSGSATPTTTQAYR